MFSSDGAELCITLRHGGGPDVELEVPDHTSSVHSAVGMKLEQDPGLLIVELGGHPIEWGENFVSIGIEDGATLCVLWNREVAEALKDVRRLSKAEITSTKISLDSNILMTQLPEGELLLD